MRKIRVKLDARIAKSATLLGRSLSIFILLYCAFAPPISAQDSIIYRHFDINNGLPSNNVYSLGSDALGYMWLMTDKGVVKYNGYNFKLFNTETGLVSDDVWRMYIDDENRHWLFSYPRGIGYLKDDKYYRIPVPDTLRIDNGTNVYMSGDDVFFIVTDRKNEDALYHYNKNGYSKVTKVPFEGGRYALCFIYGKKLICVRENNDVFEADLTSPLELKKIAHRSDRRSLYGLGRRSFSKYGQLAIEFPGKTIEMLDIKTSRSFRFDCNSYTSYTDANGQVIICPPDIYFLSKDFTSLIKDTSYRSLMKHSTVVYMAPDRDSSLWIATNKLGAFVRQNINTSITLYKIPLKGDLSYKGGYDNVFFFYNAEEKQLLKIRDETVTKIDVRAIGAIRGVFKWDSQRYCISGESNIFLQNLDSKSPPENYFDGFTQWYLQGYVLNNFETRMRIHHPKQVMRNMEDGSLVLTHHSGMYTLHPSNDSMVLIGRNEDIFPGIIYDSINKRYLFFNSDKILLLDYETKKQVDVNVGKFASKYHGVRNVQVDRFGNIYIQAQNNYFIFNPSTAAFLTVRTNLINAKTHFTIKDDRFVIAGDFGIAVADINGAGSIGPLRYCVNTTSNHIFSVFPYAGDKVLLETDQGYYTSDLQQIEKGMEFVGNLSPFSLVLQTDSFRVVNTGDVIKVTQAEPRLIFDAINFYGKGNIQYSYRVDGGEWRQTALGEIFIENIAPGRYCDIEIDVKDDLWKSGIYQLQLYRIPYWYQTHTWKVVFWISGVILFIIFLLGVVVLTRYVVTRANERRQKVTDLELRAIHSQINPHFIFNTLGTALYFINKKDMENAYVHVNKFSHLLRSYLKSSRDRYITLNEEIEMLKKYIELQQARFEDKLDYSIHVDNHIPQYQVYIPALLLQPLVENAINHGLFHKKDGKGLLEISFVQGSNNDEIICTIEDNGVGRQKSKEYREESIIKGESYGSKLTQELIDIFQSYEQMNIKIEYIDKQLPATGTIVRLVIGNLKYEA